MSGLKFIDYESHLRSIHAAAMRAANPAQAVRKNLHIEGDYWTVTGKGLELAPGGRVFLLAVGKAAGGMASAAVELLGERISSGLIVLPTDVPSTVSTPRIETILAGHPLPDQGSLQAGQAAVRMLSKTRPEDILLCLISGGASALLELPLARIELKDLVQLTQALLKSGAPIADINTVRKALSQIKGGRLLSHAAPAKVVSLILSDVIGDNLADIGSGPTVPQLVSSAAGQEILTQWGVWNAAPKSIQQALCDPPPLQPEHPQPINVLVGSNRLVLQAAGDAAAALGFDCEINTEPLQGEARSVGGVMAAAWLTRNASSRQPWASISGGETTVVVSGDGRGGRNQELALAAALEIDGSHGLAVMSAATDGVDGPTDAAGAIVTPVTAGLIRAEGIDLRAALDENDSYHALDSAGALLRTGPSGTNLNDLLIALGYPD